MGQSLPIEMATIKNKWKQRIKEISVGKDVEKLESFALLEEM